MIACIVLAGALAIRLINYNRGMWGDEVTTYWVSHLPVPHIVEERLIHGHLPTYFLLMHAWTNAVGDSKLMLRLPSIIPGALAVAALFLFCARRFPLGPSLLAGTLLGLNATHLFVSQSSRMYGLTVMLEVLFAGCLLSDLRRPSWIRYAAYAAVVVAGCSMHLLFLQMAGIAAGFIVWDRRACARVRSSRESHSGAAPEIQRQNANSTGPSIGRARPLAQDLLRYLSPFFAGIALFVVWSGKLDPRGPSPQLPWMDVSTSPVTSPSQIGVTSRSPPNPFRALDRIPFGDFSYCRLLEHSWAKNLARTLVWALSIGLAWAALRHVRQSTPSATATGSGAAGGGEDCAGPLELEQSRVTRLAFLWGILPVVVLLIGCLVVNWGPSRITPRWIAGSTSGWALLLAIGVWRFPAPAWLRPSLAILVVGVTVFFAAGWLRHPGDGLPQAFAYWRAHAGTGDKIFLAHRGYIEKAMEIEGVPLPPKSLCSGTVLDGPAEDLAKSLREFAADAPLVWVLNYHQPAPPVLAAAFAQLDPTWQAELAFRLNRCSIFRLSRTSTNLNGVTPQSNRN